MASLWAELQPMTPKKISTLHQKLSFSIRAFVILHKNRPTNSPVFGPELEALEQRIIKLQKKYSLKFFENFFNPNAAAAKS